ncbi:CRISPR-associated protein Csx16 [Rheinheimera sp.]|uniref:CRISPR-associated protein Csx16 n=1 Tax=Rheinheimera sp. TaxID=1869214 RepID=UPI003AF90401
MATFFISRHQGATAWIQQQAVHIDHFLSHLVPELVQPGDCVIGTLPLHLIATVQQQGARYLHLTLTVPEHLRGQELTVQQLAECQATIREFTVHRVEGDIAWPHKDT